MRSFIAKRIITKYYLPLLSLDTSLICASSSPGLKGWGGMLRLFAMSLQQRLPTRADTGPNTSGATWNDLSDFCAKIFLDFCRWWHSPDPRRFRKKFQTFTRPQRTPAIARLELSSSRTLHGRFTSLLVTCLTMRMVVLMTYLVIEESVDERRDPDESEHSLVSTGQLLTALQFCVTPDSGCAGWTVLAAIVEDLIITSCWKVVQHFRPVRRFIRTYSLKCIFWISLKSKTFIP